MINAINEFLSKWEPIWLFVVLACGLFYERETRNWTIKEYYYDKDKDDKKRKTRVSKKTTQTKDGGTTVEETTETSEPVIPGGPQGEGQ
jgi:hypothetical protein